MHANVVFSLTSKEAQINGCTVVVELEVHDDVVMGMTMLPYGLFVDGEPFNIDGPCQEFDYVYGRGQAPVGVIQGHIYAPAHTVPSRFPKR